MNRIFVYGIVTLAMMITSPFCLAYGLPLPTEGVGPFLVKIIIGIIILAPCTYAFICIMASSPLNRAIKRFDQKNYTAAVQLWRKAIINSTGKELIESQYNLAVCERYGLGLDQNIWAAYEWFVEQARLNDPDAHFQLANLYLEPSFEKHSPHQAEKHFLIAAKSGFFPAQLMLMNHYENGNFGRIDQSSATYWRSIIPTNISPNAAVSGQVLYSYGQGAFPANTASDYIRFSGRHSNKFSRVVEDLDKYGC